MIQGSLLGPVDNGSDFGDSDSDYDDDEAEGSPGEGQPPSKKRR